MSSISNLTPAQKQNALILIQSAINKGITSTKSHAALLSIALKEGGLRLLVSEGSYSKTSNIQIRKIFKTKTAALSDAVINDLKSNDVRFFNFVYNGVAGNGPTDGYTFRGAGANQLTGRGNFKAIGVKIGVDLEANPDILRTNAKVAADAFVQYFINSFANAKNIKATIKVDGKDVKVPVLSLYNSTGINDFKNTTDSVNAFYHANAGWGKTAEAIKADPTGGLAKAKSTVNDFYAVVSKGVTENKGVAGTGLFFLTVTVLAIINRKKISAWISKQKTKK